MSAAGRRRKAWLAVLLCGPGLAAAFPAELEPAARPAGKLAVAATRPLVFGKFVAGAGGTVTIAPNGTRTRVGGVILVASSASSSAGYLVTESKSTSIANVIIITLPGAGLTLRSATGSMTLSGFTSDRAAAAALEGGRLTLSVGATLTVGANQPRGTYTGSIPLTVEYQ